MDPNHCIAESEPEVFAVACATELPDSVEGLADGTWTSGSGTGSDVDDQ